MVRAEVIGTLGTPDGRCAPTGAEKEKKAWQTKQGEGGCKKKGEPKGVGRLPAGNIGADDLAHVYHRCHDNILGKEAPAFPDEIAAQPTIHDVVVGFGDVMRTETGGCAV